MSASIPTLPGFRDFYPDECAERNHWFRLWREEALRANFQEYDAPVVEALETFTRKSGDEIVGQLFNFTDKGDREIALRPEMTPSLARMIGARAGSLRRPIKWFSIGENYRYERPQKGRLRAFYQMNADILGEEGVAADAEVIGLLLQVLVRCGLGSEHFCLRLSDRRLWWLLLEALGVEAQKIPSVLGVIDKWERQSGDRTREHMCLLLGDALATDLVQRIEGLLKVRDRAALGAWFSEHMESGALRETVDERLEQWDLLLSDLEARGWAEFVRIDLGIVRGLAYYTGFVFEAFQLVGKGRAIAGGGRYDDLVEKMSGVSLPAVGFGMGDVVFGDLIREVGLTPRLTQSLDLFLMPLDPVSRTTALADLTRLRQAGYRVDIAVRSASPGKLFKQADQVGAEWGLLYGEEERAEGSVRLRHLRERKDRLVPRGQLLAALAVACSEGLEAIGG